MIVYRVLSKRGDEEFEETRRTSRRAAEHDVELFKDILRRTAWIQEYET